MTVFRCFVEKKPAYAVEAKSILNDLHVALRNQKVEAVRVLNRYDLENVDEEDYIAAKYTILSEPQVYDSEATFLAAGLFLAVAAKLIPPINVITDNTNIDFFINFIFIIPFL